MARFDLNLLSALHALITDCNVTRAAERLNVTQPTMSGMLQRLRYQFNDQLLVRNGRQMELTPFGTSLVEPVCEALRGVEMLMYAEPVFNPLTSSREFTLMASDYCATIFMPRAVSMITRMAPGVRLIMQPIDSPLERMVAGQIDLCITADDLSPYGRDRSEDKLQSELLFSDEFVCVVDRNHPLREGAHLDELLKYPHVGVKMSGASGTIDIIALQQLSPDYKLNITVSDFPIVPYMVANSDMVGMVQARLAEEAARYLPIRILRPSVPLPKLNETMLWHSRYLEDPAHLWLRGMLRDAASNWRSDLRHSLEEKTERPNRTSLKVIN